MSPFSQSAYTNSKPKITWNVFSVKPKRKNSPKKVIRLAHPQPSLRKLSSSTDILMHVHTQLMTGIIFIENWQNSWFLPPTTTWHMLLRKDGFPHPSTFASERWHKKWWFFWVPPLKHICFQSWQYFPSPPSHTSPPPKEKKRKKEG